MQLPDNIKKYYRFFTGLHQFLKRIVSLDEGRAIIKRRMADREKLFLTIVEKAIYGHTESPYLKLLNHAGYEFTDIKSLVYRSGIEQTLSTLVRDGVYLTFDEFKGRTGVRRNGTFFHFNENDFDNPFLSHYFNVESGGTSGAGTRTMIDFDFLCQEAVHRNVLLDAFGLDEAPCVLWFPILPGNAGLMNVFRQAKIGKPPIKWFSQVDGRSIKPSVKDRFGTGFSVYAGRLLGGKIPGPEYVDLSEARKITEYIARTVKRYSKCSVWTYVGSAIRICTAAREMNISLDGAVFFVSGEPLTQARKDEIEYSGATAVPYYAFVEGGITAHGCANPDSPDDMHVLKDRMAVISHKRKLEDSSKTVDALLFTSLLPEAPKILMNVETGDHGLINSRSCGCRFETYGFSDHISNIRSFEKFTDEGMTFRVKDLMQIVEDVLPAKYGGSSTDYQILRESADDGMSFIIVAISPRVGPVDEKDLTETMIRELGKGKNSKRLMAEIWSKAGTIRLKRMDPIPTKRGKIFPFHIIDK